MLKLSYVNVRIAGTEVLRDVSLELQATLMRSVVGLLPVASGDILLSGENATNRPAFLRARGGIGYMPEDRRLVPDWTVEQNIRLPSWAVRKPYAERKLESIYAQIPEVSQFRQRKALQLSGGQQKLVALARALMSATKLLLLGEPFEGVAPALVRRLIEILTTLRWQDALSVLISESDGARSTGLVECVIERGRVTPAHAYPSEAGLLIQSY